MTNDYEEPFKKTRVAGAIAAGALDEVAKIIKPGINGFLASTEEDWEDAINRLLEKPQLKFIMGNAGRMLVENEYCIQVTSQKLIPLLHNVVSKIGS